MTETDFHEERSRDLNEIRSKKEEFKSQKEILIPIHRRRRLDSPDRQKISNTENQRINQGDEDDDVQLLDALRLFVERPNWGNSYDTN